MAGFSLQNHLSKAPLNTETNHFKIAKKLKASLLLSQ